MKLDSARRIENLMLELVAIRSDTGTRWEKEVEAYLFKWLGRCDYFRQNPNLYGQYALSQDPLDRTVVWGLLKGKGDQTVILMHHHDVVDAYDYGNLSRWAYAPEALSQALAEVALTEEVRADLAGGEWLFGRGTADMKGGAAIQLVLLEDLSRQRSLKGNVLLLSLPDEESLSVGMRGCLHLLIDLQQKFNLQYKMLINSEPHFRDADGQGIFYEGSAGKVLPVIYVRGQKTHIGQIYQGFNPVLLLSEIVLQTELNTDFSDRVRGEVAPPPSWSYFRDRKEAYDASIPGSAGGYLSLISLKQTPRALIQQLKNSCEVAISRVIAKIHASYTAHSRNNLAQGSLPSWRVNVKTFAELYAEAAHDAHEAFVEDYARTVDKISAEVRQERLNAPEATFRMIEKTLSYVADLAPVVVIALAPPYYPPINNGDFQSLPKRVRKVGEHLIRLAADRWGEAYKRLNYMIGITDMSYAALQNGENIVPYIGPNMPLWQKTYEIPFAAMEALAIPVINIGPWGKDCHKFTERVLKRDLVARTPLLLERAVQYLLAEP
ncbi:MAG: M20/M25/M40 family metallo-hydrolase [Desulfobacterales bacterium]|nr:MAG: M20/M25/M40 family metallo-hydrolase [Desulfobacterales bacterium]